MKFLLAQNVIQHCEVRSSIDPNYSPHFTFTATSPLLRMSTTDRQKKRNEIIDEHQLGQEPSSTSTTPDIAAEQGQHANGSRQTERRGKRHLCTAHNETIIATHWNCMVRLSIVLSVEVHSVPNWYPNSQGS